MHLTTCSKATARPLLRALMDRFKNHQFSIISSPTFEAAVEIHAEVISELVPGNGKAVYEIEGFVEGFIAAQGRISQ
jgi:hypothetical protein